MSVVIEKQRLSCLNGYNQIKRGDLERFTREGQTLFGINTKYMFIRKIEGALLNIVEKEAFERLFAKYGVTENIWTNVD